MTWRAKTAFDLWKSADAEARQAEAELRAAWQTYDERQGPPPSADLMARVSQLREVANRQLSEALQTLGHLRERPGDPAEPKDETG